MSITRSACIKRAQAKMLQGNIDPMYGNEDWSDFFASAVLRVWRELVDLKQEFFCRRKVSIPHLGSGAYQLPSDFFELVWVEDSDKHPYYEVSLKKEREEGRIGYRVNGDKLLIVNEDNFSANLLIDYRHYPKEYPDYNGSDDPLTETYLLEYPFNNQRGLRLISNMLPAMAKVKDGSITEAEFGLFFTEELRAFMPRFFTSINN